MNCLIVDDNKIARTVLKHLVSQFDFISLVAECANSKEAMNELSKHRVDLILLDVEMPDINGFEFLKSMPDHPLVILITAKPEYALEAFEYNIVDFVVKPPKEERFLKAISRAKEIFDSRSNQLELNKEFFFIREKGISSKLLINDILYIQALGDYVSIYTTGKKYTIHYTLSAIEKELPSTRFMRVHRSYIVALDKIDTLEEGSVFIYQTPIPVGDSQRSVLSKRLNHL